MEPHSFIINQNVSIVPGLEMAIKTMNFTEKAIVVVTPKYGHKVLKMKRDLKKANSEEGEQDKSKNTEPIIPDEPEKPLNELEPNIAKYYSTITYEVLLIKHDKPRKTRQQLQPDERISEAADLKVLGVELFKQKSYEEAIVRFKDGFEFLLQMPTDDLTNKVVELRSQFLLNIANCHICLTEYNYALKKCEEAMKYKITPKCYYYQAVSLFLFYIFILLILNNLSYYVYYLILHL